MTGGGNADALTDTAFHCARPSARVRRPWSGPTSYRPSARTARARLAVPTPGSTTARCTVPGGKNGTADSRASAPATMSWGGRSWVRSTSRAEGQIERITPFMIPTKGSRSPKSVVSVTRGAPRKPDSGLAVPVDDEIRDQHQRLLVLGIRERAERGLGALRVLVSAVERVLDPRVLDHQPPELLDPAGLERGALQPGPPAIPGAA